MTESSPTIEIGNRTIGKEYPTYIIAEIGINHNGNLEQQEIPAVSTPPEG